jgi:hypothetical protein
MINKFSLLATMSTISFPGQDQIQKDFLQYIQCSPIAEVAKDLILSYSNQMRPVLTYPPLECFPKQKAVLEIPWKSLCLCAAYSLDFLALYEKSERQNQKFYGVSRLLMAEFPRICGSIFNLEHVFWKTFYRRVASQYCPWDIENESGGDQSGQIHYLGLSSYLLPIDMLSLSEKLTGFQYEMLEQSLLAMFKGFYNMEKKDLIHQKKLFKEAMIFSKNVPIEYFDHWINHNAHLIIRSQTHTS